MNRELVKRHFERLTASALPVTVVANGVTMAGTWCGMSREATASQYGSSDTYAGTILVPFDKFKKKPKTGDMIKVNNDRYHILSVRVQDLISYSLDLELRK